MKERGAQSYPQEKKELEMSKLEQTNKLTKRYKQTRAKTQITIFTSFPVTLKLFGTLPMFISGTSYTTTHPSLIE